MEQQNVKLELSIKDNQLISNSAEYAVAVRSLLPKYDYVVTQETLEQAKKDRAYLNKYVENVSNKRISVEKELLANWKPHKDTLMSIEKEVKSYSDKLNLQINEFELKVKNEKKSEIESYYDTIKPYNVSLDKIFDEKWLNKTTSTEKWQSELTAKVEEINSQVDFIKQFNIEDETVMVDMYLEHLDITKARREHQLYLDRKHKEIEVKNKALEKEKQQKVTVTPKVDENVSKKELEHSESELEEIIQSVVVLQGSKKQLTELLEYINSNTSIHCHKFNPESDMGLIK